MIVLDTSVVVAFMNSRDERHAEVRQWIAAGGEELVTTPLAVAEMDHLIARTGGPEAAAALRRDLAAGAYGVEWWGGALREALAVAERYSSMSLGMTDASLVALAAALGTARIATLDERHFRAVTPLTGEPAFSILPAESQA